MSHGGGDDGGESSERWLISYADFITLLMVLFVVLYSMGQMDVEKYKRLAESMRTAFSLGGAARVVDSQIDQTGGSSKDGQAKPIVIPGIPQGPPKSEEVAGQLTQMLSTTSLGSQVSVQTNIEGVLISLSEKLVFAPGTTVLAPEAVPVLDLIFSMIKPIDNTVRLIGHTDDTPPTDTRYHNNWELSYARALIVANYLMNEGIAPERLMITGRGSTAPIFLNDTPEHRQLNGRVEIVIIYKVEEDLIGGSVIP